jgi:hypothetical protein
MRDGNIAVNIETSNARGEKFIQRSAEVSQSSTVYLFTGQGTQEPVRLLLVPFGKVLMPTSSLFMSSRLSRS